MQNPANTLDLLPEQRDARRLLNDLLGQATLPGKRIVVNLSRATPERSIRKFILKNDIITRK